MPRYPSPVSESDVSIETKEAKLVSCIILACVGTGEGGYGNVEIVKLSQSGNTIPVPQVSRVKQSE